MILSHRIWNLGASPFPKEAAAAAAAVADKLSMTLDSRLVLGDETEPYLAQMCRLAGRVRRLSREKVWKDDTLACR